MEPSIEDLKAANLKLKLENENLLAQNEILKNKVFQNDLFKIIDDLDIEISKIDDDEFMGFLRFFYDSGGVESMTLKLKQMLGIKDPPKPEKSFDMPPELIKYLEQVEKNKNKIF